MEQKALSPSFKWLRVLKRGTLQRQAVLGLIRDRLPLGARVALRSFVSEPERRAALRSFEQNAVPLFSVVHLETVSMCNSRCSFCAAGVQFGNMSNRKMPDELVEKVLGELAELRYRGRISFYCNNEPLLDQRMTAFVRRAKERVPGAEVELKTNGIRLTVAKARELLDAGVDLLILNDYTEGDRLSDRAQTVKQEFRGDARVQVNERQMNATLFNRAGTSPSSSPVVAPLKMSCVLPFEMVTINPNGDVSICSDDVFFEQVMGNVSSQRLRDIWYSPAYSDLRRKLLDKDRTASGICSRCDNRGYRHARGFRRYLSWI